MAASEFESGRLENNQRDFYKNGSWSSEQNTFWHNNSGKFEYTNSTETSENSEGYIFRVPLTEISIENLKVIPSETYIIVQSNKKTIFITLSASINPKDVTSLIKDDALIISVKK